MATKDDITKEILTQKAASQDVVRRKYLADLHEYTKRDTILYSTAFASKKLPNLPSFLVSVTNEDIQGFMAALHGLKGDKLDLILHSPGGSLEAADQIVQYLRKKYAHIRAIVPQNAMSAATMIACACDTIVMGKHSAIGPIDPQVTFPTRNGHSTAPAHAILSEFMQARQEILTDPRTAVLWAGRIQNYPPGFLQMCQDAIRLSEDKVAEWLDMYMFATAEKKGAAIAKWLANAGEHKTHGRPIGIDKAVEIGLVIEPLEDDQRLQDRVLPVFHAAAITHELTDCMKIIENHEGRGAFLNVQIKQGKN